MALRSQSPMRRVLIANRGEIAVRVIRAVRELGLESIAVHSSADRDGLAVKLADRAMEIGPAHAGKSYLNIEAVLRAANDSGADAVHPGYGFLSENADFAAAVENAGLIFVGPKADSIRLMGNKALARATARSAGVPTVPGSESALSTLEEATAAASAVGFPLMIKASAGGGGRGIRIVNSAAEFATQLAQAQNEARAAFGDASVYLERYIAHARHIEVQILGDGDDVVHLFERDCSLQRRRQKIFEETPAPLLPAATRARLCASAVELARAVNYRSAGTMEYLYDQEQDHFYFIEMNTRIQVEHPITEMVTGVDLVREMLLIASGQRLRLRQMDISSRGAAIECRLNAEDPERNFLPSPGTVSEYVPPGGPGVRVDSMLYPGAIVPPFYDSLLAKIVVWDESRPAALSRMARALSEMRLTGVKSTLALHIDLLADSSIAAGVYDTTTLERWIEARARPVAEGGK